MQSHSAPDATLAMTSAATTTWEREFTAADEKVDALIPLVERRFRDLVRKAHPDAASVNIGLSYDTDGDALVYISEIDGAEVDDDHYLNDALGALNTYGYNHERLSKMHCTLDEQDHFTFDLTQVGNESISDEELTAASEAAWGAWGMSAKAVPAIADEVAARLGVDELVFQFTDTDDGRRVTLHDADGGEIEEADLLGAMNSYVTARGDMRLFPGVVQDEDDEWAFRYRIAA